jgi:hypothetical protein
LKIDPAANTFFVIPAKAGISGGGTIWLETPAFAGVTALL